jgi:hypothetical protein
MEEKFEIKGKVEVLRYDKSFDTVFKEQLEEILKETSRTDYEVNLEWARNVFNGLDRDILLLFPHLFTLSEKELLTIIGEAKIRTDKIFRAHKEYDRAEGTNLILDVGMNLLMSLMCGTGISFASANGKVGVGNSASAPATGQTALLGGSQLFLAVDSGYPTFGSGRAIVAQSTFGDTQAQWHWLEEAFSNGTTLVNRSATDLGDKTSVSETWLCRTTFNG